MRRYGIVGKSLSHSFSPAYFEKRFRQQRLDDHSYEVYEFESVDQVSSLRSLEELCGFNVTIPFKESIIDHLDEVSEEAQLIGAVNCVKVIDGKWIGYNTDAAGFMGSLSDFLPEGFIRHALILGSGGASKAVRHALTQMGVEYRVVSRTGELDYTNLSASEVRLSELIINTTPLGMYPDIDTYPDIPYQALTSNHYLVDIIYNPEETAFLRKGRILGAGTMNGSEMLRLQAEKSWDIWNEA